SPYARALQARKRLLKRLGEVLAQAQDAAAAGAALSAGGLDLLAGGLDEAGLALSDDDVTEQLLLQRPAELDWLQQELDDLPWPPPQGEAVTAYDASHAPRLDAVLKEVMRLTPPVGGFFRRTREPINLADVLIPADRVVQVSITATHRYGTGSEDLEVFRPQRHLGGNCTATLLPYGGGERVCLGKSLAELEIRLLAVGLLKQLNLALEPDQDLALMVIPSPSPKSGLLVQPCLR
ncbi:MAG: cytochrome P450, partial [Cyanobium sp.]